MAGVARGTMTEAPTEAVQEAIGYVAANLDSPNPLNYEEMMERMIQGAVAGGAIGGAFGGAGATADIAKWHDAVHRTSNVTEQNANKADQRRRRAEKQDGTVQSVDEILEELDTPQAFDATEGFDPLADADAPELQETGLHGKTVLTLVVSRRQSVVQLIRHMISYQVPTDSGVLP